MSEPVPLTERQERVLAYIKSCSRSPSVREIMSGVGAKSVSDTHKVIGCLEERGFIRRLRGRARALEVIKSPGFLSAHPTLEAISSEDLRAELRRRESTGGCEPRGRYPSNWQDEARQATQCLGRAINEAGLRP